MSNCEAKYRPGYSEWRRHYGNDEACENFVIGKIFYELFERAHSLRRDCDDLIEDRIRPIYSKESRAVLERRENDYWEDAKVIASMDKDKFIEKVLEEFDKRKPDEDKQYRGFIYYVLDTIPKSVIDTWVSLNKEIEE